MAVCSDPCSFAPDDRGVMRIRIAGDPATSEWPYDCTLQNSNLRRDNDCLWADPLARNLMTAVEGEQFPGVTMALNVPVVITGLVNLSITNPDPCRYATAWIGAFMMWTIDADYDPSINFGPVTLSRRITGDAQPVEGAMVETYHDHTGTRSTMVVTARTQAVVVPIAPGATANVGLDVQATRNDGSLIWTQTKGRLTAMLTSG